MASPRVLLLTCLVLLCLPAAASAAAQKVDVDGLSPRSPVLAGDKIVYSSTSASGREGIRVFARGKDRLLRDLPPAPADDNETVNWTRSLFFEASTGVLATTRVDSYSLKGAEQRTETAYDFGPFEGPWARFNECGYFEAEPDGNRLALTRCTGTASRVEIADVVAGTTLRVIEGARLSDLEGDLVAYHQGDNMIVRNYVTDTELYRFPATGSYGVLQADGKLAVSTSTGNGTGCYTLAWYGPEQPTKHTISEQCVSGSSVKFAGDRLVYSVTGTEGQQLLLSTLDGTAPPTAVAGPTSGFDWDGTRIVYGCGSPNGDALLSEDVKQPIAPTACKILAPAPTDPDEPDVDVRGCHPDDPTARIGTSRRCPVAITGRSAKVDSSGRVTLRVKCQVGCRGTLRIRRGSKWISKATRLSVGDEGARKYRITLSGRPPAGATWKVEIVSKSANRVRGTKTYTRAFRLVRG
jgi:hypothetical protein